MKGKKEVDIKTVSQLFEKYFKTNYKKDCKFKFINVVYKVRDVENIECEDALKVVSISLPFLIESRRQKDIEYLCIPGVIKAEKLERATIKRCPSGVYYIPKVVFQAIMRGNGYDNLTFAYEFVNGIEETVQKLLATKKSPNTKLLKKDYYLTLKHRSK